MNLILKFLIVLTLVINVFLTLLLDLGPGILAGVIFILVPIILRHFILRNKAQTRVIEASSFKVSKLRFCIDVSIVLAFIAAIFLISDKLVDFSTHVLSYVHLSTIEILCFIILNSAVFLIFAARLWHQINYKS